jgi:hypothetical protein
MVVVVVEVGLTVVCLQCLRCVRRLNCDRDKQQLWAKLHTCAKLSVQTQTSLGALWGVLPVCWPSVSGQCRAESGTVVMCKNGGAAIAESRRGSWKRAPARNVALGGVNWGGWAVWRCAGVEVLIRQSDLFRLLSNRLGSSDVDAPPCHLHALSSAARLYLKQNTFTREHGHHRTSRTGFLLVASRVGHAQRHCVVRIARSWVRAEI